MANSDPNPWKILGEAVSYVVTATIAAAGAIRYQRKTSQSALAEEEEREASALSIVESHLDRISRTLDEQGVYLNEQNLQLMRAWADIREVKRTLRELSQRVVDLESKSTDTT